MPTNISVENNFIGGLKTEFTGLNFPENACTAASNCVFSIIGDVLSREGIDYESNFVLNNIVTASSAINYYKWFNAGGDGASQILVVQVGGTLNFFLTSSATAAAPVSAQLLTPTVTLSNFLPVGSTNNPSQVECQFADGNGFLFVFHPFLTPFSVNFIPAGKGGPALTTNAINLQIRDFYGINPEPGNPTVNFRPTMLNNEHNYNLQNQGWTNASTWTTSSTTQNLSVVSGGFGFSPVPGQQTFTVASGLPATLGTQVNINWTCTYVYQSPGDGNYGAVSNGSAVGNVVAYTGTQLTINITNQTIGGIAGALVSGPSNESFTIAASNLINTINTWNTQIGNFPSNADIWWEFQVPQTVTTTAGNITPIPSLFSPSQMASIVPLSQTQAPQGHFIVNPFNIDRTAVSGVPNITVQSTMKRPRVGAWFQGRVWYAGVDDLQLPAGDVPFYTWTENIYFSQIATQPADFGLCFQQNDPTDNRMFNLLPDDGGVIVIQGTGPIYKLFPIQNGLLVFAANGVWLIRGNSGLGFTANDFSVNKISAVKSISSSSFVDILGLPMFWNNEGIYLVSQTQKGVPYGAGFGGLTVEPLTVGTILSFYNNIPFDSKRFARGTYDPISYVISWVYRSTQEAGLSNRYQFDSSLNLNIHNRAFYPYTFANNGSVTVNGIQYVDYPSGSLLPQFKYLVSTATQLTFAEEKDNVNWVDWFSTGTSATYISQFTTGYKVHGQAFRKWHPIYVNIYSRNFTDAFYVAENFTDFYITENGLGNYIPEDFKNSGYVIQGVWDYANSTQTGRVSSQQVINNPIANRVLASGVRWPDTFDVDNVIRRHRIPGHGNVLQFQITSLPGLPFHIIGWSIPEQINTSA